MPKICDLIGKKEKVFKPDGSRWPDLVGIELELENVNNAQELPYWAVKQDNSLRNGIEYVLDQPYGGASLQAALDAYYQANLRFENTLRTSSHIHVNVLDTELDAVRVMAMFMYMIEDGFYNVIEADRKWSGYSMPLSEMNSYRLRQILSAPYPEQQGVIRGNLCPPRNQERYYGFNLAATAKYGTVEFRYFPGGPQRHELESWIDFCLAVKRLGVEIATPVALIDRINNEKDVVDLLLDKLPGDWGKRIIEQCPPEQMLAKFNEVAALVTDYVIERREPMVFLTTSLFKYVGKKLVNEEGLTYLEKLKPLGVLNAGEWDYHLDKAMAGVTSDDAKPLKTKTNRIRTYDATPGGAWDDIPPPVWQPTTRAIPAPQQTREQLAAREIKLMRDQRAVINDPRLTKIYAAELAKVRQDIRRLREQQDFNPFDRGLVDENGDIE